jgi:hypothetical protein
MPARKTASTQPAGASTSSPATTGNRKPWIKKSPVDVVLEQITKQEEKVSEMRTELAREERLLTKMQKAKSAFEAE